MGVTGLLPLLKSIQKPAELKSFKGLTLAIDGYGWLHRAAYCCALELGQDKPTDRYVTAAMHRVKMLIHFGVKPYMVFDGDYLPSKAMTEDSRAKSRNEKKKLAMELLKAGKQAQATQEFQKCIDVTPEMASMLIQQLKKIDVPYLVAPYEADAQLVYLERQGLVDGIISDDSDLLVFGAKRLLTKLDKYGHCIEINRRDFCRCREVSLTGWSDAEFRRMAILSGCDYLEGLPSVGLKTAYRMLRKSKSPERVVQLLQFQGKRVSENYLTQFYQAELTFLHQWVFCPESQELVHLTELDGTMTAEGMPYIGSYVKPDLARAIAKGDVNPITKAPIVIAATPTKRRHSQTTTAISTTRTITRSQAPGKPIDSYFKGQGRIPMGAMDPNCFSVDAQRLAELTDGGLVPRVFPLPRPYLHETRIPTQSGGSMPTRRSPRIQRRRTEPIGNMLASVAGDHSIASTRPTSSLPASHPDQSSRPPKKARLCDDAQVEDGSPKQSKFFSASKSKTTRRAKSDAYLLSDDSIEEALRDLPDFDGWKPSKQQRKSIAIFEESSQGTSQGTTQSVSQSTSQETAITEPSFSQQDSFKEDTSPCPRKVAMPPPALTKPLSSSTPSRSRSARFSYSSTTLATPVSAATSRRSSVFSSVSTPSTGPSTAASTRETPLQRLRSQAYNSPKPRPQSSTRRSSGYFDGIPVNPAFVPLPRVDLKEVEALNVGSEDMIGPDSDGEDLLEEPVTRMNVSRFVFS